MIKEPVNPQSAFSLQPFTFTPFMLLLFSQGQKVKVYSMSSGEEIGIREEIKMKTE